MLSARASSSARARFSDGGSRQIEKVTAAQTTQAAAIATSRPFTVRNSLWFFLAQVHQIVGKCCSRDRRDDQDFPRESAGHFPAEQFVDEFRNVADKYDACDEQGD